MRKNSGLFAVVSVCFITLVFCTSASALDITVSINHPSNGSTFEFGETIYFSGKGFIAETELDLTGGDLVWMSSLDGRIGTGTFFSNSTLSLGHHRITLIGVNQAVTSIEIDVSSPASPPVLVTPVTTGDYSTYNLATNTLYIPYSPFPGLSYWINMSITSYWPLKLEVSNIGENEYSESVAYATFNPFTNTLHVPDYRDINGVSYWFDLQLEGTGSGDFILGGVELN